MDEPEAWALRERYLELWPSTVAKSLGALGLGPRGRQMIERLLRENPGNLSLLKHATALSLAEAAANPSAAEGPRSLNATATFR
jgi:hypothetical protein